MVALLKTYLRMSKRYLAVETIYCEGSEFVKPYLYLAHKLSAVSFFFFFFGNEFFFSCSACKIHMGVRIFRLNVFMQLLLQKCLVLIMNCKL